MGAAKVERIFGGGKLAASLLLAALGAVAAGCGSDESSLSQTPPPAQAAGSSRYGLAKLEPSAEQLLYAQNFAEQVRSLSNAPNSLKYDSSAFVVDSSPDPSARTEVTFTRQVATHLVRIQQAGAAADQYQLLSFPGMLNLAPLNFPIDGRSVSNVIATSTVNSLPPDFDDGTVIQAAGYRFEGAPTPEFLKITNPRTPFTPYESYIFTRTVGILPDKGIVEATFSKAPQGTYTSFGRGIAVKGGEGVEIVNVSIAGFDPAAGETTRLQCDLVPTGPNPKATIQNWTVNITSPSSPALFKTFTGQDPRGPGTVTPNTTGLHLDVPWDGRGNVSSQIAQGDLRWSIQTRGVKGNSTFIREVNLLQTAALGVRIVNAKSNPDSFDPAAGENVTLNFGLETSGLTQPTVSWNVTVRDANNNDFQQFSGQDSSGNLTTQVSVGPWAGNSTAGNVVSGPFKWIIAANVTTPTTPLKQATNVTVDSNAGGGTTIEIFENKPGGVRLASSKSLDGKSASTDAEFEAQLNKVCRNDTVLVRLSGVPTTGETTEVGLKLSLGNSNERPVTLLRRDKVFEAVMDLRALENESASLPTFHTIDASEPINDTNEFGEQLRTKGFLQAGRGFEGELLASFTRPRDILLASNKYGTRDFEPLDSCKTSPEQVLDAGYHVLRVRYTPPNASDIPIETTLRAKKQAKSLYIGGHGDFYGLATPRVSFYKRITGFQSELKPGAWKDLRTVIFGACTILNLNNYKNNATYQTIASPPGGSIPIGEIPSYSPARVVDAATRGQAVVLGYASTAPAGPFGFIRRAALLQFDTKILREYFTNLGPAPTDQPRTSPIAWCRANAAIDFNDNACAIDDRGYYYIKYKIRAVRSWGRAFEEHYDRAIVFVPRERWDLAFKADHRPETLVPLENVFLRD